MTESEPHPTDADQPADETVRQPTAAGAAPPGPGYPPPGTGYPGADYPPPGPGYPPPGPGYPPPGPGYPPPGAGYPPPGPSYPPPGAGFPPPGGFPPPPPGTGGFATRYGLVRPVRGRMLAGVCAAIARATNTDPVLWRVLFAVLTLAGGLSIFVYVVGWLLIPTEGDTGSPLEALFGQGRSRTSPALVVIAAVLATVAATSFVFGQLRAVLVVATVIAAAVVLISNRHTRGAHYPAAPPPAGPPPTGPPRTGPSPTMMAEPPAMAEPSTMTEPPTTATPLMDPPVDDPTGYRPPFAPHGPYASSPFPYPGLVTAPPPPAPPARPRSRLGRFTLSLTLLALGVVGLVDALTPGYDVAAATYAAVALATVGAGLVIGAWVGRSRGLIPLGLVLVVLLAGTGTASHVHAIRGSAGDVTWAPASIGELLTGYDHSFGDANLDLSAIDFTGQDRTVTARVSAGTLTVTVPRYVDVVVTAAVKLGNADVFGTSWDGVNNPSRTITDNDSDGPGHGHLTLNLEVSAGTLEVTR